MTAIEFVPYGKTPRLFRDVVITEKIDGTNAAVGITVDGDVYAQSRNRLITPESDNAGFARWVAENADTLATDLGAGLHFGEWWGSGIQRGYGLTKGDRRFSLFNARRWAEVDEFTTPGMSVVPVLTECPFDTSLVRAVVNGLIRDGSKAAPGFMRPEGVIVYHAASGQVFKALIENDQLPKGIAA